MKRIFLFILVISMFLTLGVGVYAKNGTNNTAENTRTNGVELDIAAKSAVLMEAETGKILYAKSENEAYSPASVTKIMTLLLVCEAIEGGRINPDDKVTVSKNASGMGGSQVFLEEGESFTVEELIKCTVIASANDAAVALAEHVAGSEKMFVSAMNRRANELELKNTNFENTTGLDDTTKNHYSSAYDIAIMSKELIKYDIIKKYSSLWQDTIRNGEFTLTNTNRLVRYYDGCNGLKTGSTAKAGYCISATAERGGMQLIAVIMGADTRDSRNASARTLLDYGFSSYMLYKCEEKELESVAVRGGRCEHARLYSAPFSAIITKGADKRIEMTFELPSEISAPLKADEIVGSITYTLDGEVIGYSSVYIKDSIEKINIIDLFVGIIKSIFMGI